MTDTQLKRYTYQTTPNDPFDVKIYTLSNGLKLFLSVNPNEPRIYTNIVVRAGSKHDPADATGLAHYMEHMFFKGTSRIGAMDWEQEKVLLDKISALYEQHRQATDEAVRKKIYAEIDRVSFEAAKLVAPNEYDKLATAIGASDTNANTWLERVIYINDIPSNELERWMILESERFRLLALRLFHTELETVYEEFNIGQDSDFRKVNKALREMLFPRHPYGTQTTIGSPEHLKNPSHVKIQEYFQQYYVPNNMAILLAGDFEPDEAVALAEQYFGDYQAQPLPPFVFEPQPPIEAPIRREVFGKEAPYVEMAWRLDGSRSEDALLLVLIKSLLYNQQAGLMDIHLNQQQKMLESEAWQWLLEDYSLLGLYGQPREGQSLEEVEALLFSMVEKLRQGDFEDWLIAAIIKNFRLEEWREGESNQGRVSAMANAYVQGMDWAVFVQHLEAMQRITKQQVMDFVSEKLGKNYAVAYKKQGEDPNVIRVQKPPITPVELNREAVTPFANTFLSMDVPRLAPQFVDFESHIQRMPLSNGLQLDYVYNAQNPLFRLDYIFEMGKNSDLKLALALQYLPYLGTIRYTPARLQQEFYRLGLSFDVYCGDERAYVTLSGLEESLEEGIQLFEHILASVQEDTPALQNMIADILTKRDNAKKDRNVILRDALGSYARYGTDSPFAYRLPQAALQQLEATELTHRIQTLTSFEHRIYYYGQKPIEAVAQLLEQYHQVNARQDALLPRAFTQIATTQNRVFFLEFPIVQTDIMLVSKGTPFFNLEEHVMRELYNDYFGYGLSSIVFQEIRESKALAYSTYAFYTSPRKKDLSHYLQAYVGTQPDKISDAVPAMLHIMENMPFVENQIENAKLSILKRVESERITPRNLYWESRAVSDLGYGHDLRRDLYETMKQADARALAAFHQQYIKGRSYSFLILGSKKEVDLPYFEQFGAVEELSMEQVFGY